MIPLPLRLMLMLRKWALIYQVKGQGEAARAGELFGFDTRRVISALVARSEMLGQLNLFIFNVIS